MGVQNHSGYSGEYQKSIIDREILDPPAIKSPKVRWRGSMFQKNAANEETGEHEEQIDSTSEEIEAGPTEGESAGQDPGQTHSDTTAP